MNTSKQTPIKLADFKSENKDPKRKQKMIFFTILGSLASFFIVVLFLNIYVYGVRESLDDDHDLSLRQSESASDELAFIDTMNQFEKEQSVEELLNERINGTQTLPKKSIEPDALPLELQLVLSENNKRRGSNSNGIEKNGKELKMSLEKSAEHKKSISDSTPSIEDTLQVINPLNALKNQISKLSNSTNKDSKSNNKTLNNKTATTPEKKEKAPFFIYRDYSVSNFVPGHTKKVVLPITSVVRATLLTDLNSASPPATVVAKILNVPENGDQLKGCTLIGQMRADIVSKRIFIAFHELILANNTQIKIDAIVQDSSGRDGLEANMNNNTGNDLLKEGLDRGFELLTAYVGGSSALNGIQDKQAKKLNTDIVLSLDKHVSMNIFFQQHVEI